MKLAPIVFLLLMGSSAVSNAAVIASYDASLGTLPEAQGFTREQTSSTYQEPVVSAGAIHQFVQPGTEDAQFWYTGNTPLDFNSSSYELNATIQIVSSNYVPNIGSGPRFGYYLGLFSTDGRGYVVGITAQGVALDTDVSFSSNNDFAITPFNTTDGFHDYRLATNGGSASLYIDGAFVTSTNAGNPVFTVQGQIYNTYFGDASGRGISESYLRTFNVAAVPLPGGALLLWSGLAACGASLRRNWR